MPPEAKEIDVLKQTVLREHLNALSQTPAPEESSGVFTLDRGYIDDQNNATPLGEQYLLLLDNGLIDDKGELTEDGKLYSKTQKESVYGSPVDYIKREKLGLNQLEKDATKVGFGDSMLSMGKQFFTESIPAMFEFTSPNARLDPLQFINDASTLVKSSLLALEPLATGTISKIADASLAFQNADADEKETASLLLKQEYERKRYDYDSITGADLLTALSGGSTVPNQMRDLLIKQKGEENVTRQEQAVGLVGSFVDPSVIASMGTTAVAKAAGQTMMRSLLNAEKQALKFSVLSTEQAGIRSQMAALESALSRAEGVGAKVTEKASAFDSVGKTAESIRYKATAARIGDRMQDIKGKLDELAVVDSTISTDLAGLSKKAGVGDALIGINNKIQQFNALPANAIGQTVETIGNGLIKADAWLDDIATKTGIDGVYDALKSIPGLSAGLVLGPAAAIPTIGARILASGPFLESVGKYTKILGKELMQARGSSSYWQRVANNPTISNAQRFLSHRMDELTLGGYLPEVTGNVVKGTAASYPMNLAIEYLQDPYGETKDILDRAAGASLVFGGGFSGVSQMFKGSKETLKAVRIGDELNFTRNLLESQKAGYNSLGKGSRRMVSSFAAAFPNLNWEFADGLPSRYDPVTNTVRINPKSNNPLRPLIAHEVGHYISIRNGSVPLIRSMLLGDAETPGILRKTNGELDPEFQRFKDEYDKRTDAGNIERRTLEDIAEEYFIENTVDHMVEMVESGELSKMTGRTQAGRQLRKFIQTTMPRVPILKDFFFRTGGAMQAGNKFVDGNGLLAEGLRELPEAKAMMRNLIRDTAGEASSIPRGKGEKGDAGNRLPVQKGDPIVDSFHSILESDTNGQPLLDKDGDHIPLSRATDEARQAAGLVLIEEQIRRVNDGYMPEDGEIKLIPDKGWQGRFISPATINALAAKGILNAKQIAILRNINTATRQNSGTRYMVINHPATIKRRGGKIRYASLEAALRETVPVGFTITKTGNILVHLMSVDQLHKNVTSRAASKRGRALYQGNPEAIKQDISAMMDMHTTNTKTDKYYQDKYGPKWEEHQQFINTIFGQMTKEQRSINPMFDADKIKDGNVYRTYRLDRISKATKMDGTPIPFNYDYVKVNYFPDGVVDKSEQMSEQPRYMPEVAVIPERFTGSAADTDRRGKYVEPPGFFRKFNIDSYERGGRFFDAANGEDLTGKKYSTGSIDVSTGKPRLFVDNISDVAPSGNKFKTNLFKQKAGWKWTSENPPPTSTIVSVEGQGKHIYTLKANFEGGVELARYSEKVSEPRLRPTAYGEIKLGEKVGEISIRGKSHPVYDSVGIIRKVKDQTRQMPEEPITSSSERWKSMSNEEKDAYVFTPVEMTPSNRAEFNARVESGSLSADTPVVDINRSNLLTSKYGPPSSSATGNINTWIDDNTGKPVAVAFSENGNIPTKGERNQTPRYMPEKVDADYMKAVESGDVEAQQKAVDEAAKASKYTAKGIHSTWTGSKEKPFYVFDFKKKPSLKTAISDWGVFFAPHSNLNQTQEMYAYMAGRNKSGGEPRHIQAFLKLDNPKTVTKEEFYRFMDWGSLDTQTYKSLAQAKKAATQYKEDAISQGHDGFVIGDSEVVVFSPSQIKSADPITRDDSGNIIPPSKRFNTESKDIRYMPEKRQEIGDDMVVDRGDKDTIDVTQAVDKKGKPMWKADKPVLVSVGYNLATAPNLDKFAGNAENPSTEFLDNIPYNLNGAEKSRVEALIKNGVVDRLANDMAEKTRIVLKDPAIAAGKGWYSRMREKLLKALGESGRELFSQFLGATSAQTPVDENFLQTVDAYEGMMSGRYNRHRKGYLTAIRAESKGKLNEEIVKSRAVEKTEELISKLKSALPSAKKAERIPIYAEIKSLTELIEKPVKERTSAQRLRLYIVGNDLLPRRSNGAKFNANSGAVLKVIAGVWLNNRESPKTPNFAGNLSGRTTQATIDIWAARYIRRMIYGGEGTPWRIQPKSEIGVSNEDFAFSQVIMQRAAEKLKMNPDDLQAILWFAEKDVWDKNKWTKNEGAKKSSFDDIFDVFFPEGRKPLTFAEGFALMKANKAKEKSIAEEKKKSIIKAEAASLGISIAALNKMKSKNKSK